MDLFTEDIALKSYKAIKDSVDNISLNEGLDNNKLDVLINILKNDGRKNVIALGTKLQRCKDNLIKEIERVKTMYTFDRSFGSYKYVAGVDEVGRGPLAGPIVACAVILDIDTLEEDLILGINDSKKLSEKKREELSVIIKEKALAYNIAVSSNEEIDNKGIAYSNNKIFLQACNSMAIIPELVLSDGYLVKGIQIENKAVIKGDTKSACIAAASIVAKVYRDNLMKEYAEKYPYYHFEDNVGYGTSKHIESLKKYGPCSIHRTSFLTRIL